jgi:predicted glutamine amidotransferase
MYGKQYHSDNGNSYMEPTLGKPTAIVIASEPFTLRRSDWMKVERNTMMIVDETLRIRFQSIELPIEEAMLEVV